MEPEVDAGLLEGVPLIAGAALDGVREVSVCRDRTTSEEVALEYLTRIKVHELCRAGVLVELSGEFDLSCLEAFERLLEKAASLGRPAFVDLSGVTFMDGLCVRELAARSRTGSNPLRLCRPSWQVELSLAAFDLEEGVEFRPDDDPGYEAVISEVCGCGKAGREARQKEHHLYLLYADS